MPASARVHADCFCKGGCQAPPRMVHATRCGTSHRNRASGQKHKLLPLRRGRCLRRSCRVGHWHRALCYAAGQPFRKVLRRLCFACSLTVGHVVGGTVSLTCAGAAGARRAAPEGPWPLVQSVMAAARPDLPVGSCGCKQAPYPAGRSARSPASDLENRLWGDPNRLPPNLPLSESLAAQGAVTVLAWR